MSNQKRLINNENKDHHYCTLSLKAAKLFLSTANISESEKERLKQLRRRYKNKCYAQISRNKQKSKEKMLETKLLEAQTVIQQMGITLDMHPEVQICSKNIENEQEKKKKSKRAENNRMYSKNYRKRKREKDQLLKTNEKRHLRSERQKKQETVHLAQKNRKFAKISRDKQKKRKKSLESKLSEAQNVIQQIREKEDRPRPINEKEETDTVKNDLLENSTTFVHWKKKLLDRS